MAVNLFTPGMWSQLSAVLAMRTSSKLRRTQERLSFNENFKPRPKTEFGHHAGVILEGWLEKKQTSSPGLWNRVRVEGVNVSSLTLDCTTFIV